MALTKRQKQVVDFIAKFVEDNGYSPSYEEIAHGLNLASLATVHKHISTLETKQYLKRGFNQSRSLDLGPKYVHERRRRQDTPLEVPLLGRIAAGAPVEAIAQKETVRAMNRLLRAGFSSRAIFKVLREWELPEEVAEEIEEGAGDSDSYAKQNDEEWDGVLPDGLPAREAVTS